METKTKRGSTINAVIAEGRLTITVKDGEGEPMTLVIDPAKLSPEVTAYAILHGMKQRIVDAAAIARDEATGVTATPTDKFNAMNELVLHYMSGSPDWSLTRSGGEARESGGLVLRALATVQGVDIATMRAKVAAACEKRGISAKAYYKTIADAPAVASEITKLKASGAKVGDAEALMAELGGE